MRILYIVNFYKPAYVYGGPARSVPLICEGMARAGAKVTVFTTNANGGERLDVPLARPAMVDGVEVWYFPLSLNFLFYSPALTAAVERYAGDYDVVDIDSLFGYGLSTSTRSCRRAGVPYVVPLRGQMLPWCLGRHGLRKRLYLKAFGRSCLKRAAALHCTDHREMEELARLGYDVPAFVVPNPVDAAKFVELPERGGLRRELGIPETAFLLLFLGRLHEVKRPEIAVRCLTAGVSTRNPVHLLVAGPDEQNIASKLRDLARSLGCESRLHLLPLLDSKQILRAFTDSDLLLMPSQSENFGMTAAEAMAAGLPVLCSDAVPAGRWGAAAGAGRTVPCRAESFIVAVQELAAVRASERECMGERGRQLIRTEFDSSVIARKMLAHFESIRLAKPPRQRAHTIAAK